MIGTSELLNGKRTREPVCSIAATYTSVLKYFELETRGKVREIVKSYSIMGIGFKELLDMGESTIHLLVIATEIARKSGLFMPISIGV